MFEKGMVVYSPSRQHTIRVEEIKTFDGTGMILLKGTRLKKDGTPYRRRVHNLLTHLEEHPLQIINQ